MVSDVEKKRLLQRISLQTRRVLFYQSAIGICGGQKVADRNGVLEPIGHIDPDKLKPDRFSNYLLEYRRFLGRNMSREVSVYRKMVGDARDFGITQQDISTAIDKGVLSRRLTEEIRLFMRTLPVHFEMLDRQRKPFSDTEAVRSLMRGIPNAGKREADRLWRQIEVLMKPKPVPVKPSRPKPKRRKPAHRRRS
jgi:hypothetical protein